VTVGVVAADDRELQRAERRRLVPAKVLESCADVVTELAPSDSRLDAYRDHVHIV